MTTLDPKSPQEIKVYTFDFTARLDDLGTSITTIDSVAADTGLTVDDFGIDSTMKKVTATLSGGTASNEYKVTCRVTLVDGQKLEGAMTIPVDTK